MYHVKLRKKFRMVLLRCDPLLLIITSLHLHKMEFVFTTTRSRHDVQNSSHLQILLAWSETIQEFASLDISYLIQIVLYQPVWWARCLVDPARFCCKLNNFKWPSMKKCQCLIYKGTLESLDCSICSFFKLFILICSVSIKKNLRISCLKKDWRNSQK